MASGYSLLALGISFLAATSFVPKTEAILAKRSVERSAVAAGDMPWLALVEIPNGGVCTGTIVSPTTVLSAAVCLPTGGNPENGTVSAGNVKYTQPEDFHPPTQKRAIASYHLYDDSNSLVFNMMALKVAPHWKWTREVQPIAIIDHHEIPVYSTPHCTIAGFGYGSNTGEDNKVARSTDVWMAGWRACLTSPQEHRMCTFDQESKAPCVGDLGGSVLCDGDLNKDHLYGIISEYGHSGLEENPDNCKLPARASGFQFVGFYAPWIKSIAGDLPTYDEVKAIRQQETGIAVQTEELESATYTPDEEYTSPRLSMLRQKRDEEEGAAAGGGATTTESGAEAVCEPVWHLSMLTMLTVVSSAVLH